MNWLISIEQFEDLLTSRPSPPYFLFLVGLLITLACALSLVMIVRQRIKYWSEHLSPDNLPSGGKVQVILPFSGTAAGVCISLASGLEILGLPVLPSLFLAFFLTGVISYLGWLLLGRLLSRRAVRSYLERLSDISFKENRLENSPSNRRPS